MRTRIIGCFAAIGLLGPCACSGKSASFSDGDDTTLEGESSVEDASDPTSSENETSGSNFETASEASQGETTAAGGVTDGVETEHSEATTDESVDGADTESTEATESTEVTDDATEGGTTEPSSCAQGGAEACGSCGERVCDPAALTWGPCTGDERSEECWEGEDGSALPADAAGQGSCSLGQRVCAADGEWSACLGAVAPQVNDTCDVAGNDDNCNQLPNDECECTVDAQQSCADTLPCTDDSCVDGTCSTVIKAEFCVIDGQCHAAEQAQADNICSVCNPALSQSTWSGAANGTQNPSNPCQICSGVSLVANVGADCGSEPSECSAQDTCDANAACQANDEDDGKVCSEGECNAGECEPLPFDCVAPSPPTVEHDANIVFFFENDLPPEPEGGTVRDGKYTPFRIDVYGATEEPTYDLRTFEVRAPYVQVGQRPWIGTFFAIGEFQFAGSFTTSNNTLVWDLDRCDPQLDIDVDDLEYTASVNGLVTLDRLENNMTVVVNYARLE
jgi:hypothetical protein